MTRLQAAPPSTQNADVFLPPPQEQPHIRRQMDELIQEVAEVIAPIWPLRDYVAVNPYAGVSTRRFLDAREFLKVFSDCETLMPLRYFAAKFGQGQFGVADIKTAMNELGLDDEDSSQKWTVPSVVDALQKAAETAVAEDTQDELCCSPLSSNSERNLKTVAESMKPYCDVDWSEAIREEISKHCANHYDEGQAVWQSPWKRSSLFQAWRQAAEHDRNIEIVGLSEFRKFVARLPFTADAVIVFLLERLNVPPQLWASFLLCQAFSIPGWSAWAKYQSQWRDDDTSQNDDLLGLLAIRLAYDVAVSEKFDFHIHWDSIPCNASASFRKPVDAAKDETTLRYILLRASEVAHRDGILYSVLRDTGAADQSSSSDAAGTQAKLAQMVFCIDVRSERVRRNLESTSDQIETFGFAGFFGMPVEFVPIGQHQGPRHLPVLLKPQFQLHEGMRDEASEALATDERQSVRSWRSLWRGFQSSAVGCFSFVETTGLLYGWKLFARTLGLTGGQPEARFDAISKADRDQVGPTLRGLQQQGVNASQQVEMAAGMLKNMGLTSGFARFVVLCGHASQTDNNPLAAGLDCGACGGHSGEPNARFAAMLLNQSSIREALAERGIHIPAQTHFLAGLHNTTTDQIDFFDLADVPASHKDDLETLAEHAAVAGERTRKERLPVVASNSIVDLMRRAVDWSEVRPEWGLAGNAAFIAAPRSMTKHANLDGRAFLHSYEHEMDADGSVLETIMTAPMVVAHWINMQYYASTVDNHHFGSGNKTVHNVVGRFGILSGNGGDLKTGLPWQSLHTGDAYQHQPMRLQAIIAAPRSAIEQVVEKHGIVADLLGNGWLHLVAIEDGTAYRYVESGDWQQVDCGAHPPLAATLC